jgi:hypothetical protein
MIATRPRRHGKRAFVLLLATTVMAAADPGWRLTVVPSFERPLLSENIPGAQTALLAVAREAGYGELEYATTRGAWRRAREIAAKEGGRWIMEADVEMRRDTNRVIDRILITGENPLLPSLAVTPAFFERFEPILGEGFHVIIPDRNTIALYPRLAGEIPPAEAGALIEIFRLATYPVSREVFRATRRGLEADGILEE